jgi:hypothetical protein
MGFFDEIKGVGLLMRNLPNLSFLLIELANELKFNKTQGQDWGTTLTKNKTVDPDKKI